VSVETAVAERNILPCLARKRTLLFHFLNPVDVRKISGTYTRKYRGAANCEIAGTNLVASWFRRGQEARWLERGKPTALSPSSSFCQLQKRPQWLKLWISSWQSECFWIRRKVAWIFRCDPSSDQAVLTAAEGDQRGSHLVPTISNSAHWRVDALAGFYRNDMEHSLSLNYRYEWTFLW